MAARDDKISNKRRRLFKALSAAPVVATLHPGSALATSSAYQCLNTGHDISNWHPHDWANMSNPCPGGSSEACYAYEYRYYIDTDEGRSTGKSCPSFNNIIVEVRTGKFYDLDGLDVTNYIGSHSNGKKKLLNSSGQTCKKRIPVRQGLFAVVGHKNANGTGFTIDGVVPEKKIKTGYQGISGTCMNSIIGVTPQTLARG